MTVDLAPALSALERQRRDDWHLGAQVYVSLGGETVLDTAIGESAPGRDLDPDDVMLWFSAGKPLTGIAIMQLWERGLLGLDDLVADYIDGWGNGKERCTIRHVLTHTGGFPMTTERGLFDLESSYADVVAAIAASPAEWEPGTGAGYHLASGTQILGAIVERVDGRSIDQYVRDEVLAPVGSTDCWIGIPPDEQARYGDRIAPVYWKGHLMPARDGDRIKLVEYRGVEKHNNPALISMVFPGGGMRGPARQLARVYESMLGFGPAVLAPETVQLMAAVHRWGLKDHLFGTYIPWGLHLQVDFSGGAGRRCFGHGGMASSRGLADPERGLVMVMVSNGLPGFIEAESRLIEITDAVYSALPEAMQYTRRPVRYPKAGRLST